MTKLMKEYGIQSIDKEIVADLEILIRFAALNGLSDKGISDAVIRVSEYLADYKLDDSE